MKKIYEEIKIEILKIDSNDVIATSSMFDGEINHSEIFGGADQFFGGGND